MTRTALITGATTGIGYELARCFAQDGYDLVLVARTERELARVAEELRAAHGIAATALAKDLSHPAAAEEIAAALARQRLTVDVLVNNAGFGAYGPFAAADLASQLEMIQVNLVALTQLTKWMLGGMLKRGEGKILNVASTAAFQPGPLMAVYYATKAYVLSFSEALANELQGCGVSVTALCPGPTRSEFLNRAGMQRSNLFRGKLMEAGEVARIGYRGLMQRKAVVIPGMRNQLLALSIRCVPRGVVTSIVRKIQESR